MNRANPQSSSEQQLQLSVGNVTLDGDLTIPPGASGIVLFAHGSGSSRHSSRNRYVAQQLQSGGLATLLLDLLTIAEERIDSQTAHLRFDIGLLARRLIGATDWLAENPATQHLRVGYFGASTGAGAALVAAAERPAVCDVVVSRGGRPDLASAYLHRVQAATLLIVGSFDTTVVALNRQALAQMNCEKQLEIVPGASHLFEEPGKLEIVARLALDWFTGHLSTPPFSEVEQLPITERP
jgi:putative phosphoribosyl transferase